MPGPEVLEVSHSPIAPTADDDVVVTARLQTERAVASVQLLRASVLVHRDLELFPMLDDGEGSDEASGDGVYTAVLPRARTASIMRLCLIARDDQGGVTLHPEGAPERGMLYQVIRKRDPSILPTYRVIMDPRDLIELLTRDPLSDERLDCTFVGEDEVFYNAGIRLRGESSRTTTRKSFRVQLARGRLFRGKRRLNLNALDVHRSHLASQLMKRVGLPVFESRLVTMRMNDSRDSPSGGLYAQVEAVNRRFLKRVSPGDDHGNLYRGRAPAEESADLTHRGDDPDSYRVLYEKRTNEAEDDFSDIISLTDVFTNTSDEEFPAAISKVIDVDEWLTYFAAQSILANMDDSFATRVGEDYFLYHRPSDGRWLVIPWDLNETCSTSPTDLGMFRARTPGASRLLEHPAFRYRYLTIALELAEGPFSAASVREILDDITPRLSSHLVGRLEAFLARRRRELRRILPTELTVSADLTRFVRRGATWKFWRGKSAPSETDLGWTAIDFDDSDWETGRAGFGYGEWDDNTVLSDMRGRYGSVFIRHEFEVDDPAAVAKLELAIRYDDGFVCYLNGEHVTSRNAPEVPRWNTVASREHEAVGYARFDGTSLVPHLRQGKNVIAIVGLNLTLASSDFSLDPWLHAPPASFGVHREIHAAGRSCRLAGMAPILRTRSVTVGGRQATYEVTTGRWHVSLASPAERTAVELVARDAAGRQVSVTTFELVPAPAPERLQGVLPDGVVRLTEGAYHVVGDLSTPASTELIIEPGTSLFIDPDCSLSVMGTLTAIGVEGAPIRFEASTDIGPWGGLQFIGPGARGSLEHVEIRGAGSRSAGRSRPGIDAKLGAQVTIAHSLFADLEGGAIRASNERTSLVASDTVIRTTGHGIRCRRAHIELERVSIRGLCGPGDAIDLSGVAEGSRLRDCLLEGGPRHGLRISSASPRVEDVVIRSMLGSGIRIRGDESRPSFRNVHVEATRVGLQCRRHAGATLGRCTLRDNHWGMRLDELDDGDDRPQAVSGVGLVLWGNRNGAMRAHTAYTVEITESIVQGGFPGEGNRDQNPSSGEPPCGATFTPWLEAQRP